MILNHTLLKESQKFDDQNSGTLIVDATCAPSQIKYPQDTNLPNEARKSTEKLIDFLHTKGTKKPRTYRKKAHTVYMGFTKIRKPLSQNALEKHFQALDLL